MHNISVFRFSVVMFFISILLFGFHPANKNIYVIEKGNIKYLSNTIVVKLNQPIASSADGTVILPSSIETTMSSFRLKSSRAVFSDKVLETDSELGRIIIIEYDSDADPVYVSSKIKNHSGH
jgi:hypothetical protein